MNKKIIAAVLTAALSCCVLSANGLSIVPAPEKYIRKQGEFKVNAQTRILLRNSSEELRSAAEFFTGLFADAAGYDLQVVTDGGVSRNVIECVVSPDLKNDESYRLTVRPSKITITGKTAAGIFYGFQTLRQLLPPEIEGKAADNSNVRWSIPSVDIDDTPAYSYRGIMLDVSRHFFTVEEVKRNIDLMAFHKLNVLHWHLTDDQGWRIEIRKYPKLTSVGGFRDKTIIGHARDIPYKWDTDRYGGYYTQEEIRDIVQYAAKRFITVIPEIEMPGHSVAALAAYPEFSCSGGPFEVEGRWGVFYDVYCTKEKTFKFLEDVLDEVMELFPSEYIHIGGDEVPKRRWHNCAACQERMRQENIPDEEHLQSYFINRMEKYLNSKGRRIIGWDEILEGNLSKTATVMSWRGIKGGVRASKEGRDVILSPNSHFYLNHYQIDPKVEELTNTGNTPLWKAYGFNPLPDELNEEEQSRIIGVQGNIWTEYMTSQSKLEYFLYPRAAAVAEVGWSGAARKDFDNFYSRMLGVEKHYDLFGLNYCKSHRPADAVRFMGIDKSMLDKSSGPVSGYVNRYVPDVIIVNSDVPAGIVSRVADGTCHAFIEPACGPSVLVKETPLSKSVVNMVSPDGENCAAAIYEFGSYVLCCPDIVPDAALAGSLDTRFAGGYDGKPVIVFLPDNTAKIFAGKRVKASLLPTISGDYLDVQFKDYDTL
ncbi:MAG: beta-N-acetylhexosaminidase [Candidatus Cryptobacteroides sp.]